MGVFDALRDPEYWRMVRQGATDAVNRGAIGGLLGAPVDAITGVANAGLMGLGYAGHKAGLLDASQLPQPIEKPVGGSEWIGDKMQKGGYVSPNRNALAEVLAGLTAPVATNKLAKLLYNAETTAATNAMSGTRPVGLNAQAGAINPTKFEQAHQVAQRNAALPVEQGGLGLPPNNTAMERMNALAATTSDDAASRAHQFGELNYQSMPISKFKGKLIHKSPSYNRQQSSEYRTGAIGDEQAYMRKSNHWGDFATNIKESDPIARGVADITGAASDQFGRIGSTGNSWVLRGGLASEKADRIEELRATFEHLPPRSQERADAIQLVKDELFKLEKPRKSEAGYVLLNDLIGKVPEKKSSFISADGGYFTVPTVSMNNGQLRSRFAAFDPMRRNETDLLGNADPRLLGGIAGGGLLGSYFWPDR
jgi:hypothetical protein